MERLAQQMKGFGQSEWLKIMKMAGDQSIQKAIGDSSPKNTETEKNRSNSQISKTSKNSLDMRKRTETQ